MRAVLQGLAILVAGLALAIALYLEGDNRRKSCSVG